jgi:hypothetical protein
MIVIIAMANIWMAYFRFVFHQTPFLAATVLSNIRLNILQMINDDALFSLL